MLPKDEQSQALLGEEYGGSSAKLATSRRQYQPNFKRLFFVLLGLNCIVLILVGTGVPLKANTISFNIHNKERIFPDVSIEQRIFTPNESFYKVLSGNQERVWNSLIPTAGGFVRIEDPERYGLSGGYPLESAHGVKAESYCVSVFHQLHCLNSIREHLELSDQPSRRHVHDELNPHGNELHVAHCIDYLRQSIMCSGDMSLEKASIDHNGNIVHSTNGWEAEHTCKSWDQVFDITESMNSLREVETD